MITANQIMLLMQLVHALDSNFSSLEEGYDKSNKEKFDEAKKVILELNKKISFLLKDQK